MLGRSSDPKDLRLQTTEDKIYLLKLVAHQMLGAKWIYYRKIKRGEKGLKILKEKSLMEQMKATRAALKFTTKNAKKLYRLVYQECLKDIKKSTGLSEDFPILPETGEGTEVPSLTSEFDAIIISWTPIKFLLPIQQLRAKGQATQRHTEGLAAKLFFKVVGFYAVPENWDRYKLNLYLRRIKKSSSYQDIVSALEPLKNDLAKFIEIYEPFKFGKASLSKDVAKDTDAFDDAMGVESFESQLNTLYWYNFIYSAMELFLFRYYLTLISSTASADAIQYLTSIFGPALQKAIEIRTVFLGSFETDRTKKTFRIPYRKLIQQKLEEPIKKNIKTQQGVYETYLYNLSLLDQGTISFEIEDVPKEDSEWGRYIKQFILNINRPTVFSDKGNDLLPVGDISVSETQSFEDEQKKLEEQKEKLKQRKIKLVEFKKHLEQKEAQNQQANKNDKIELEEEKTKLLKEELKLDRETQKLKELFAKLDRKISGNEAVADQQQKRREAGIMEDDNEWRLEEDRMTHPEVRSFVLMNIMNSLINCIQFKRLSRYNILERFKQRAKNDQELEAKRVAEIQKKADKKLREMNRKMSKMQRLKQNETVNTVSTDIKKFRKGVEDRIQSIKKDSQQELMAQKERLNSLFQEISKEKSIDLGITSKMLMDLIHQIDSSGEFSDEYIQFVSNHIQNEFIKDFEPFYKNMFSIFELPLKEKMLMIQALEKSGANISFKLELNENEEKDFKNQIEQMKADIEKDVPDLFSSKVIFLTKVIPVEDLFKMSLDNKSLNTLLLLKLTSAKSTQSFSLNGESIKALIEFNKIVNPIPKNRVLQPGREKDKNPEKRLNSTMINNILDQLS